MRQNISSLSPWENRVGYSRAVRVGNTVEVSGTTAMDGDTLIGPGNVYLQAQFILKKIETALQQAGAGLKDVVRSRMFVTNINQWEAIARAHSECFDAIRPATSMIEVQRLIRPELLIEIEVTAIIDQP